MISSLDCWLFILNDLASSVHLRVSVGASFSVAFLMYCWEIVEPPPVPPVAWLNTARRMPVTSKPEFVSNVASSAEYTACLTTSGTSPGLSSLRSPPGGSSLPITVPSAS